MRALTDSTKIRRIRCQQLSTVLIQILKQVVKVLVTHLNMFRGTDERNWGRIYKSDFLSQNEQLCAHAYCIQKFTNTLLPYYESS